MAEAAPSCRLYLTLPAKGSATLEYVLAKTLDAAQVACILLCQDGTEPDPAWDFKLRELTRARDVALLIENDVERAKRMSADGVHIAADAALYRQAREHLGQRVIIGVGCNGSRHEAMVLAELGADYVAFGLSALRDRGREERAALIAWWSEIFVVPCVAWNVETPEEAATLSRLRADFIALPPTLWQAEDAAERIVHIAAALREARSAA
jgi:thiamine-phosphate pyrophosphorylase